MDGIRDPKDGPLSVGPSLVCVDTTRVSVAGRPCDNRSPGARPHRSGTVDLRRLCVASTRAPVPPCRWVVLEPLAGGVLTGGVRSGLSGRGTVGS